MLDLVDKPSVEQLFVLLTDEVLPLHGLLPQLLLY
jgi:hypothetical protein